MLTAYSLFNLESHTPDKVLFFTLVLHHHCPLGFSMNLCLDAVCQLANTVADTGVVETLAVELDH